MAHILVIDDDPQIRDTVTRILRSRGHTVLEAAEGSRGVAAAWGHEPDLVITDIYMPGQDGFKTLRELRAAFPNLPIIVMSGGAGSGLLMLLEEAESLGANRTIPKPFTPKELLEAVRQVLRDSTPSL